MSFLWIKQVFREAFKSYGRDNVPRLAAALSFYTLLAISPMLVFLVAVTGLIQNSHDFRQQLLGTVQGSFGRGEAGFVADLLKSAHHPSAGIIGTILGVLVAMYGASGLFEQLRESVNAIWRVQPKERGIWGLLLGRLTAFLMVIVGGAIAVAWIGFDAWMGYVETHYGRGVGANVPVWKILSFFAAFVITIPIFVLLFKYLPFRRLKWSDVWIPAGLTALLFAIGKYAIGLYFSFSSTNAAYGTAGAIVAILLWIYYVSQIFFFGVEISYQYARQCGSLKDESPN